MHSTQHAREGLGSRFHTSEHLGTSEEMRHVSKCGYLTVRALRFVDPDAMREAMRDVA